MEAVEARSLDRRRHRRLTVLLVTLGLALMLSTRCTDYLLAEQGPLSPVGESPDPNWRSGGLAREPRTIVAEVQGEGHTCGYHALAAIYKALGRNPVACRMRFRLGVDITAIPAFGSTRGTLHPDLLRVLTQDGFHFELVEPRSAQAIRDLERHLGRNRPALLLEKRRETGGLHWVVADHLRDGTIHLKDSLRVGERQEPGLEYLQSRVLSVILVRPRFDHESEREFWAVHEEGIAEMKRVQNRLKALE